ncbi:ATPase [Sphingomonas sp. ASV193]|uniref:F0F1 ATP synthase subunit B family protein n=1 Tax=Sphingomonas sp. ASV193 TaxID=3144405 RepID=UPI0032E853BC
MPQLTQLGDVALSQLIWMVLVLGFLYFVIGKGMVPKVQSTMDDRDAKIAADLAAAEQAKAKADEVEEAYRAAMDASRGEANKLTGAAKADGAKASEERLAKADAELDARAAEAAARIKASRQSALAEIEAAAAELASDIAVKVAGVTASPAAASAAVKEALHG